MVKYIIGDWLICMYCICTGVAVLQKSIRLYAPFYSSDIIIASPLGLRTVIGAEGENKRDFDFLSSIEILIIDEADIYLMQNWEHVLVIPFYFFKTRICCVTITIRCEMPHMEARF